MGRCFDNKLLKLQRWVPIPNDLASISLQESRCHVGRALGVLMFCLLRQPVHGHARVFCMVVYILRSYISMFR